MVWLIGCGGMLGTGAAQKLEDAGIDFVGTDREVDITDFDALDAFRQTQKEKITFIINCAAYTAVDKAEDEPALAEKINADGPRMIARVAKRAGARLIHISTDYVFDGAATAPYAEDAPLAPIGVYGRTKAAGEAAVQAETDAFYILRTAWLYGDAGRNFVSTMIQAMNTRDSLKVVADQYGTPTYTADLAAVIIALIRRAGEGAALPSGIYHVTGLGETNWYEFAKEIQRQAGARGLITHECAIHPCTTAEYPTKAKRPAYSVLCKDKIQTLLGIQLRRWQESLAVFLASK